ncbi:MAG: CDP-glycerol glycerophosphotransferase family protein [Methanobacterium sp.]
MTNSREKILIICENSRVHPHSIFEENKFFSLDYKFRIVPEIRKMISESDYEVKVIAMDSNAHKILQDHKIPHESFEKYTKMSITQANYKAMELIRDDKVIKEDNFKDSMYYEGIYLWEFAEFFFYDDVGKLIFYQELTESILQSEKPQKIMLSDINNAFGYISTKLAENEGIEVSGFKYLPFFTIKNLFIRRFMTPLIITYNSLTSFLDFRSAKKQSLDYTNQDHNLIDKKFTLLFLTDNLRIIPQILPVIKKIPKYIVGIMDISNYPWPNDCEKLEMNFKLFNDYKNPKSKSSSKKSKKLWANWNKKEDYLINQQFMTYKGISLLKLTKSRQEYIFKWYFKTAIKYLELTKSIIQKENPDLVVLMDERGWLGRAVAKACRLNEIPTLILQHGIHGNVPFYGPSDATKFSVYGNFTKDLLVKAGVEPEKIVITGGQQWDKTIDYKEDTRREFCREYGLDENKPIILLAHHLANNRDISEIEVSEVIKAAKALNTQLIIRAHPSEPLKPYNDLIKNLNPENVKVFKKPHDYTSIMACDVLITQASTVAMDAIIAGKPVITINFSQGSDMYPYAESGAAIGIYTKKDLLPAIQKVLNNPDILNSKRDEFIFNHLYKLDGKSTDRVFNLIMEMLEKK